MRKKRENEKGVLCESRLFVARKPIFLSSNRFLSQIKRRYGVKKAGFSGTLDPFACGVLTIAFGQYTKLFRFLKKSPKIYRATLWLGAESETLDIESIGRIEEIAPLKEQIVAETVNSFKGEFRYAPPKYSAKKVDGKRAYSLAREGRAVDMQELVSKIHDIRLLHYRHPFVTFEANVSEGTYIRSLGEEIAKKLGTCGSLSYLERLQEGVFRYEDEKALNPLECLKPPFNRYLGEPEDLILGKKLHKKDFKKCEPGIYHTTFGKYFAIIEIDDGDGVAYLLNKVELCSY
ncbi:MAG: tRNA pseudouridine(55) synthase TruB [Hydrogenimonas sp.]|nr:tRNA pseudouridine(55) synthase TruB [Hydrogenimonas sp.]